MVKSWGETAYLCYQAGFDGVQGVHPQDVEARRRPGPLGFSGVLNGLLIHFYQSTVHMITCWLNSWVLPLIDAPMNMAATTTTGPGSSSKSSKRSTDEFPILRSSYVSSSTRWSSKTKAQCQRMREICVKFEEARVDFVDLSGGTFEGRAFEHKKESTKAREAYFIEFAEMIRPLLKKTKVYVTGGLRTAAGMVRAIESRACDGIGIGRPLAAEPYLCKDILSAKITGAIENLVPLPLNTQSSGTQLHQIGHGDSLISDWSVESEVKRWIEGHEKETERKKSMLPKVDSSGYAPLKVERGFAYLRA